MAEFARKRPTLVEEARGLRKEIRSALQQVARAWLINRLADHFHECEALAREFVGLIDVAAFATYRYETSPRQTTDRHQPAALQLQLPVPIATQLEPTADKTPKKKKTQRKRIRWTPDEVKVLQDGIAAHLGRKDSSILLIHLSFWIYFHID